jgi:hypothetical protein
MASTTPLITSPPSPTPRTPHLTHSVHLSHRVVAAFFGWSAKKSTFLELVSEKIDFFGLVSVKIDFFGAGQRKNRLFLGWSA